MTVRAAAFLLAAAALAQMTALAGCGSPTASSSAAQGPSPRVTVTVTITVTKTIVRYRHRRHSGSIYVSFYDYAGSGDVFPGTTVNGATPVGAWYPVPTADIGASAEPSGCTASAG
jgi:hypothetical protein